MTMTIFGGKTRVSNDHNLKLEFWRPYGRLVDLVDQGGPEGFSIGNGAMTKILRVQKCGNWLIGGWSLWQHAKMDNQLKPTRYQVFKISFIVPFPVPNPVGPSC